MSQMGLQQASFRAIHGQTGRDYNSDAMLAMETELEAAEIAVPADFNSRMIAWLRLRLDRQDGTLNELMHEFAQANGAGGWSSVGSFDPFSDPVELVVAVDASADDAHEVISTGQTATSNAGGLTISSGHLAGCRFLVPTLPQGAEIVSAHIQFVSAGNVASGTGGTVRAENADAAAQYSAGMANFNISSRTLTDPVTWDIPMWSALASGENERTPDLKVPTQTVVDRPGFDGVLAYVIQGVSTPRFGGSIDSGAQLAPVLTIVYRP